MFAFSSTSAPVFALVFFLVSAAVVIVAFSVASELSDRREEARNRPVRLIAANVALAAAQRDLAAVMGDRFAPNRAERVASAAARVNRCIETVRHYSI